MSNDNSTELWVERFLQSVGFQVEQIPETETQTPDFYISDSKNSYLVEVKDRFPDTQELKRRSEILERGEIYNAEKPLSHNRNISNVIRDAVKQLSAYTEKKADFRLVWLRARTLHPDVDMQQLEATLYGTMAIIDRDTFTEEPYKPCYFFTFNSFFEFRDTLDGAIVSDEQQGKFCLNPHSARYQELKQSALYQAFGEGVCDPVEEEAAGTAYIADWDRSRKDKNETLGLLQQKYKRPGLLDIEFKQYSGEMLVPSQDE